MPSSQRVKLVPITSSNVQLFRDLRVKLVEENPDVFGEDPEIESKRELSYFSHWLQKLETVGGCMYGVKIGSKYIGLREMKPLTTDPKTVYIGSTGILKDFQQAGHGRQLMEATYALLKETSYQKVHMIVRKSNLPYLNFIKPYKFQVVGVGEYDGIPEYYLEAPIENLHIK